MCLRRVRLDANPFQGQGLRPVGTGYRSYMNVVDASGWLEYVAD
jgi:hypothetical protein